MAYAPLNDDALTGEGDKKALSMAGKSGFCFVSTGKGRHIGPPQQPDSGEFLPRCGFLRFTLQERRKTRSPDIKAEFT